MFQLVTGLSSIPPRYREAEPNVELAARLLNGDDLHIVGGVGSGKSMTASAVLKGVAELAPDLSIGFINAYDLRGVSHCVDEYRRQMGELFDVDVLAIDGIDIGPCGSDGYEILYRVLSRRYPVTTHTITTSFYDGNDLLPRISRRCGDVYARAILGRIDELSETVCLHATAAARRRSPVRHPNCIMSRKGSAETCNH